MIKFIIKRLLALIPVLVGVSLLVFFILDLAPVILPRLLWVSRHVPKISKRSERKWD